MLRSIQKYSEYNVLHDEDDAEDDVYSPCSQGINDVNPLSLVFEVCRYWDKSLAVYELLSS